MTASETKKEWLKKKPYGRQNGKDFWQTIYNALDLLEKSEAGLIIELPVPIGTEVYEVCTKKIICYEFLLDNTTDIDLWGKTIFATKEEAENRLKELRNESK